MESKTQESVVEISDIDAATFLMKYGCAISHQKISLDDKGNIEKKLIRCGKRVFDQGLCKKHYAKFGSSKPLKSN